MGDLSPAFSVKLKESVKLIAQIYKGILDEAKDKGQIHEGIDTRETANFIVSSWHESLIQIKSTKGTESLKTHKRFILNALQHPMVAEDENK